MVCTQYNSVYIIICDKFWKMLCTRVYNLITYTTMRIVHDWSYCINGPTEGVIKNCISKSMLYNHNMDDEIPYIINKLLFLNCIYTLINLLPACQSATSICNPSNLSFGVKSFDTCRRAFTPRSTDSWSATNPCVVYFCSPFYFMIIYILFKLYIYFSYWTRYLTSE